MQGRVYAPGDSEDKMAAAIKDFNEYVIHDKRVEVIALPFRDGVNIVQRRYSLHVYEYACVSAKSCTSLCHIQYAKYATSMCVGVCLPHPGYTLLHTHASKHCVEDLTTTLQPMICPMLAWLGVCLA